VKLLLAAGILVLVFAGTVHADTPVPLSPTQATSAIQAPGEGGSDAVWAISQTSVINDAQQPGAVVQGAPSAASTTSVPNVCWQTTFWRYWGAYPYQQRLWEARSWCAHYGFAIYYRVSHFGTGGVFSLCSGHDAQGWRTGGGIGYSWVEVRTTGNFDCPTNIPWITIHTGHWMQWRSNSNGASWSTGQG